MKRNIGTTALLGALAAGSALAQETDTLIAQAVVALPEQLREDATVVRDTAPGERKVLREGTNGIICRADSPGPGFRVDCFHPSTDAMLQRYFALLEAGTPSAEVPVMLDADVKAGKFRVPAGAADYILMGQSFEDAVPLMTVMTPGGTTESTGLLTDPSFTLPWLMWAGTGVAHVMIPGK